MKNALEEIKSLRLRNKLPCPEALKWLAEHPSWWTLADAWKNCHRADWMIWFLRASGQAEQYVFELKVLMLEVAERVLRRCGQLGIRTSPRSWEAVRLGFAYLRGQATREEFPAAAVSIDDVGCAVHVANVVAKAVSAVFTVHAASIGVRAAGVVSSASVDVERQIRADRLRQLIEVQ